MVALGPGARGFAVGDRVMAVVAGGGQAERAVVHERHLLPVPNGVSWEEAGGFPEVFTTAFDTLFSQCDLRRRVVCVHGAAGGVGIAGVQLAVAAGARVVATVNDAGRRAEVAELTGCTAVDPAAFGDHGPFDVVLELVGAPNLPADLRSLAPDGRLCVIGVGAGAKAELNLLELMGKRARIHGSTLPEPARSKRRRWWPAGWSATVVPLLAAGTVRVPVQSQRSRWPGGRRLRALRGRRQAGQDRAGPLARLERWVLVREQEHVGLQPRKLQRRTFTTNARSPSGQAPMISTAKNPMMKHTTTLPTPSTISTMRCGITIRMRKNTVNRLRSSSCGR